MTCGSHFFFVFLVCFTNPINTSTLQSILNNHNKHFSENIFHSTNKQWKWKKKLQEKHLHGKCKLYHGKYLIELLERKEKHAQRWKIDTWRARSNLSVLRRLLIQPIMSSFCMDSPSLSNLFKASLKLDSESALLIRSDNFRRPSLIRFLWLMDGVDTVSATAVSVEKHRR